MGLETMMDSMIIMTIREISMMGLTVMEDLVTMKEDSTTMMCLMDMTMEAESKIASAVKKGSPEAEDSVMEEYYKMELAPMVDL